MEISKELKAKLLKANSEEEVKALLGDKATEEEASKAWHEIQNYKAEQEKLEAVDDDEMEAVSGGAFWQGEIAPDGHEYGCFLTYHPSKVKYCPVASDNKHNWVSDPSTATYRGGGFYSIISICSYCGYKKETQFSTERKMERITP